MQGPRGLRGRRASQEIHVAQPTRRGMEGRAWGPRVRDTDLVLASVQSSGARRFLIKFGTRSGFSALGHGHDSHRDVPPECGQGFVCRLGFQPQHTFRETLSVLRVAGLWPPNGAGRGFGLGQPAQRCCSNGLKGGFPGSSHPEVPGSAGPSGLKDIPTSMCLSSALPQVGFPVQQVPPQGAGWLSCLQVIHRSTISGPTQLLTLFCCGPAPP